MEEVDNQIITKTNVKKKEKEKNGLLEIERLELAFEGNQRRFLWESGIRRMTKS